MAHERNNSQKVHTLAINSDWLLPLFGSSENRQENLLAESKIEMSLRWSEPRLFRYRW
jgi:hypothetical protein